MTIHGLQKMTLLDFPGHVACTVFLGGCDFRCPYCHNFELVDGSAPAVMEEAELFAFLEKRRGLLDGVAVTGGEPCLRSDLTDFLSRIRDMGYKIKLDTNGAHPDTLKRVLAGRIADYVAMDIKNSPEKYARTVGLPRVDLAAVRKSADMLMAGETDYEFRTTVTAELHEDADFHAVGQWIRGAKRYYLQPFTDRDTVPFEGFHAPDRDALDRFLAIMRGYVPDSFLRGAD